MLKGDDMNKAQKGKIKSKKKLCCLLSFNFMLLDSGGFIGEAVQ